MSGFLLARPPVLPRAVRVVALAVGLLPTAACAGGAAGPVLVDPPLRIVVDAGRRHQTIEGYGTALIGWEPRMRELYASPGFQRSYAEELGFNFLRVSLWGPALPYRPEYEGEGWRAISREHLDRSIPRFEVFVSFARTLRRLNPEARIIGTVWSPPEWMKENRSLVDRASGALEDATRYSIRGAASANRLRPEYRRHYVKWLVEMAKLFAAEGAPLYAISIANEPMFTQTFESAVWTAEDLATVVGMLGEQLEAEGLGSTRIFAPETMTGGFWTASNRVYVRALMDNPAAARHLDVFATHGYTDGFAGDVSGNSSAEFRGLVGGLQRPYWVTEGGTGGHPWPEPLSGVAAAIHNAFVHGGASAFIPWQVSQADATEHNLMVMDQLTKKTHVVRHFSRFVQPGAVRVDAVPSDGLVGASAYVHPERRTATVVLINPGNAERRVELTLRDLPGMREMRVHRTTVAENLADAGALRIMGGALDATLPARSIVTLQGEW